MKTPLHICILTTIHPADDVRVFQKMALTFLQEGFQVSWVGPEYVFFDWTVPLNSSVDYHFFPFSASKRERLTAAYALFRTASRVADVDWYFAPDPDSALVALLLARKNHARVIFDIHEYYHKTLLGNYIRSKFLKAFLGVLLKGLISRISALCDLTIAVSPTVLRTYNRNPRKSLVVRNCAPSWFAQLLPAYEVEDKDGSQFTIMHGKAAYFPKAIEFGRGTDVVLEAIHLLKEKIPTLRCIMFDTLGEAGHAWFENQLQKLGIEDHIDLRPGVPMQDMPAVLQTCHVGLISYRRSMEGGTLANRVFEYMAAGLPIIAPVYSPETAEILEKEQCGLSVDFEDPAAVAGAIWRLYQDPTLRRNMGRRAREAFEQRHNWSVEVRPLLDRICASR